VQAGLKNIHEAAANLNQFSSRVDSATSRGELQTIVNNSQQAARELVTTASRLREIADGLNRSETRLSSAVARADSVFAKVNSGEGSLGLLVNDPRLYRNTDSLMSELRALVVDFKKNPKRYLSVKVF
jgi:phospholipid/cholesterol/gamma-HCH transport system substrate-binding protein